MRSKELISFLFFILVLAGCKETEVAPARTIDLIPSEHLLLGNPSNATADPTNATNFLIQKPQYTFSYSRDRGTPNWVSWHVSQDWLGSAPRQDDFRADNTLPAGWYRVGPSAYSGSGFDRGHNVPSADRTKTEEDNSATFLMTNMIPQAPKNNQEAWANLEDYTRDLVGDGQEVYVIMGSYGVGGTGSNGRKQTIADGKVTVPAQIWKVLVVLPEGNDDLNRITSSTRVIAVNTPNNQTVRSDWGTYRTSIDEIESTTGYDLLSSLSQQLQVALEAKVDNGPTQ
ncbi:DNA/RNA non-specific endonuclease [Adhaeribacter rhizoryzae]|uniref:DNA/RNA non-specific endonuclease n=1 Tax=Adhaeribacter rhizoryzae TaxID=2607907 RepID=A0A5M6CV76_9BACT|nr:DNA/RNA non-specific endonuclease [Adhaeribacter rhizoryzae]KAA5539158.1 DNA/RNA non-specific endonuclease [Adhaeribacter rhizoryzae]